MKVKTIDNPHECQTEERKQAIVKGNKIILIPSDCNLLTRQLSS
jgi:hypothetical protein